MRIEYFENEIREKDFQIKELACVLRNTKKMKDRVKMQNYLEILYEEIKAIEEECRQQEYKYYEENFEELEAMYAVD